MPRRSPNVMGSFSKQQGLWSLFMALFMVVLVAGVMITSYYLFTWMPFMVRILAVISVGLFFFDLCVSVLRVKKAAIVLWTLWVVVTLSVVYELTTLGLLHL